MRKVRLDVTHSPSNHGALKEKRRLVKDLMGRSSLKVLVRKEFRAKKKSSTSVKEEEAERSWMKFVKLRPRASRYLDNGEDGVGRKRRFNKMVIREGDWVSKNFKGFEKDGVTKRSMVLPKK